MVELWDGQSLVFGRLAEGLLVWFIWVFAHWASPMLSSKQEREASPET